MHREFCVRSVVAILVTLPLTACSFLDQVQFGGYSLDPNKIYLRPATVVSVSPRETYRYACVGTPLLCVSYGFEFECRCP
jgi:hypothetical protein